MVTTASPKRNFDSNFLCSLLNTCGQPLHPIRTGLLFPIMQRHSVLKLTSRGGGLPLVDLPPPFLAPSLHFSVARPSVQCSNFSSTTANAARDLNKRRGVSAIHRTGPRQPLGVSIYPLPKPVPKDQIEPRQTSPDHPLWGFFPPGREALSTPEYDSSCG